MAKRDMSEKQFRAALVKHGFGEIGFFGYVSLAPPHSNVHVSLINAGPSLREKLAYLLREQKRQEQRVTT